MLTLILLAQVATATPKGPTPTVILHPSVDVGTGERDTGLAGAAKNRKINKAALKDFAPGVYSTPTPPVQSVAGPKALPAKAPAEPEVADEARWRSLARQCRDDVEREEQYLRENDALLPEAKSQSSSLLVVEALEKERQRKLAPYRERVDAAKRKCEELKDDCRKAGCLPGWLR